MDPNLFYIDPRYFKSQNTSNEKQYKFDYLEDEVKKWKTDNLTRGMLSTLPLGIFNWLDLDGYIMKDYYGEDIENLSSYHSQRETFIDYLYNKYHK